LKVGLISTVYNEEANIRRWIAALRNQTSRPDEFVIVDGGSKDRTVELLNNGFNGSDFPKPRVVVQRCNIAAGRNIAIRNTTADIIVSLDGGSEPDPRWLEEITKPFRERPEVHAVGGWCPMIVTNELQRKIERTVFHKADSTPVGGPCSPSSRNVAFRRTVWEAVGGYPEWLTLTAEDLIFNQLVEFIGYRFYYQPGAIVRWENRPSLLSYARMLKNYGYGAAEARQGAVKHLRWLASTLFPPIMLLSKSPLRDLPFRYVCNLYGAIGWLSGILFGRKPPAGWRRINGVWISPQAIASAQKKSYGTPLIAPDEKFA
jgi:glycosyltransferase involved in cell wall biosynthesis